MISLCMENFHFSNLDWKSFSRAIQKTKEKYFVIFSKHLSSACDGKVMFSVPWKNPTHPKVRLLAAPEKSHGHWTQRQGVCGAKEPVLKTHPLFRFMLTYLVSPSLRPQRIKTTDSGQVGCYGQTCFDNSKKRQLQKVGKKPKNTIY